MFGACIPAGTAFAIPVSSMLAFLTAVVAFAIPIKRMIAFFAAFGTDTVFPAMAALGSALGTLAILPAMLTGIPCPLAVIFIGAPTVITYFLADVIAVIARFRQGQIHRAVRIVFLKIRKVEFFCIFADHKPEYAFAQRGAHNVFVIDFAFTPAVGNNEDLPHVTDSAEAILVQSILVLTGGFAYPAEALVKLVRMYHTAMLTDEVFIPFMFTLSFTKDAYAVLKAMAAGIGIPETGDIVVFIQSGGSEAVFALRNRTGFRFVSVIVFEVDI